MNDARNRCREFGRGLYRCGVGAGVGLVVFLAAYLAVFASRGPLTAHHWFSPEFSSAPEIASVVFVTTAGLLGRGDTSIRRVIGYSFLGVFFSFWAMPGADMGWPHRKARLLENPLFGVDYVWIIFAFNILAIAVSYAFAPYRLECSRTANQEENLVR